MSALRKTMEYFGLAEVDPADPAAHGVPSKGGAHPVGHVEDYDDYDYEDVDVYEDERHAPAEVTPIHRGVAPSAAHRQHEVSHSEVSSMSRIVPIYPRTYNEAKDVGENLREGVPVIMNVGDMDDNDAKRLVDFAAGLVFGLNGTIQRVSNKVFLLSPASVEVTGAAGGAQQSAPNGLFNQS